MSESTEATGARRPGIRDIARAAGTAVSTVSRALNNHPDVSEEKRARILAIAAALGYRQNAFAQGLIRGQSSLVAVIANEFNAFNGEYFTQLLHAMASGAKERHRELLLSFPTASDTVRETAAALHGRGIAAGVIVVSPGPGDEEGLRALQAQGFPVVVINPMANLPELSSIASDNTAGAYAATRHLLDLGHRDIATLLYLTRYSAGQDRRAGYLAALSDAGITPSPVYIAADLPVPEAVTQWLAAARPPTAILCFNDSTAYTTMHELTGRGLAVPGDVSVVGFGNLPTATRFGRGLTTVHQSVAEIGAGAVTMLADLIAGTQQPGIHLRLPTHFVPHGSTGPARIAPAGST